MSDGQALLAQLLAQPVTEIIPQRPPFLMVNRVLDGDPGHWARSEYYVDPALPVFTGHFPDFPVLPGVLITENMAQTACWALASAGSGGADSGLYVLARITQCSFSRMVRPGEILITEARLQRDLGKFAIFDCLSQVGGQTAAKAELLVARAPRPDHAPA